MKYNKSLLLRKYKKFLGGFCFLKYMFYSRNTDNKINLLHERALRLVYDDYELPFDKLLEKDSSFTIHHCNIETLCTELYKVYHKTAQTIFSDLFVRNNNTRAKSDFIIPQINTVLKGSNSIRYYGPVIWNSVPAEIKYVNSLQTFKNKKRM